MNSFHHPKITSIQTFDFSTLYTSIPHQKLKDRTHILINQIFLYKNGSHRYKHLVVNGDRTFFTNEETSTVKKYDETLICQMIDFLTDNIYIKIGDHLFRQCTGMPMGTNCAQLLTDLFLYSYEVEFLRTMTKSNKKWTKAFNLTSRYIDDLISKLFLKGIYPEELVVSETSESRNVVSYLNLLLTYQMVTLFAQSLARGMHLISTLSIFLTYLETFQRPSLWFIHLTTDKIQSGLS